MLCCCWPAARLNSGRKELLRANRRRKGNQASSVPAMRRSRVCAGGMERRAKRGSSLQVSIVLGFSLCGDGSDIYE